MGEAAALRDAGMHQADLASLWDPWPREADRAIEELARRRVMFTAEDLRAMVGDPDRPGLIGARILAAARAGIIERAGYVQASRPERRGGVVALWRGTSAKDR